jgi:hypothetical protein
MALATLPPAADPAALQTWDPAADAQTEALFAALSTRAQDIQALTLRLNALAAETRAAAVSAYLAAAQAQASASMAAMRPNGLTFLGAVGTCHAGPGTDPLLPPLELDLTSLGLQEGDLVWSAMALASTSNRDMTPALTDGWTPGTELYANDTWDTNTHCQWRIMGATPDDYVNYVYTFPTAAVGCVALAFRPSAGMTITITHAAVVGANTGNANPPAATASADGFSIVCGAAAFGAAFSGDFSSLSSGYTAAYSGSAAGTDYHLKLAAAYAPIAAGPIDPGAFAVASDSTSASWAAYHYLITAVAETITYVPGTAYSTPVVVVGSDGRSYACMGVDVVDDDPVGSLSGNWSCLDPDPVLAGALVAGLELAIGWDCVASGTDPLLPATLIWSRGRERYRAALTYAGTPVNCTEAVLSYSGDAGATWVPVSPWHTASLTYLPGGAPYRCAWNIP